MGHAVLDDRARRATLDPQGLAELTRRFPEQLAIGREVDLPADLAVARPLRAVHLLGMGTATVAGLVAGVVAGAQPGPAGAVSVWVHEGFDVPAAAGGPQELAVCLSYSGNTPEVLGLFAAMLQRGTPAVAITTGGRLEQAARAAGVPVVLIPWEPPRVRCVLPFLLVPLLRVLAQAGVVAAEGLQAELGAAEAACRVLRERIDCDVPAERNPAKQMALFLQERLAWLYGSGQRAGVVCRRWQYQLNENAKAFAAGAWLPQLSHNEVVAWEAPGPWAERLGVMMVRDPEDEPVAGERLDRLAEKVRAAGGALETVRLEGQGPLPRMLWGILLGDFVSLYLAWLRGVDPTAVPAIAALKAKAAGGPSGSGKPAGGGPAHGGPARRDAPGDGRRKAGPP